MSAKRILIPCAVLAFGCAALVGCDPAATKVTAGSSGSADPASADGQASPDAQSSPASSPSTGSAGQAPAPKASDTSATATAGGRAPYCGAGDVTLAVSPVRRPINHLLITATNTSATPCDLGLIAEITFEGGTEAKLPDGLGGGPNILEPGRSNYQAVLLDQQDAPGTGTDTSYMTLELEGGDTVKIENKAHVHAPSTTVWHLTVEDALSS
ncbi:DUF4232 domain-containing protein [Streptomyces phyllanthi]|nr:DUF4232 domain-containing protein [Streptomyces phyllanthi]